MRVGMLCAFLALCGCGLTNSQRTPTLSKRFGRSTSGSTGDRESQKRRARSSTPTRSVLVRFAHDRYASVGRLAHHVLELDGGVMDLEFPSQAIIDRPQNRIALGSRYVGDFHVSRKRIVLRPNAPDMKIVHI